MAQTLGGKVEAGEKGEFGCAEIQVCHHFKNLEGRQDRIDDTGNGFRDGWMGLGDKVTALPASFKVIAETPSCPIAAMVDEDCGFYRIHLQNKHAVRDLGMFNLAIDSKRSG